MSNKSQPSSHSEAIKSTSIIGGSAAIVMFVRIVRTKALATLLGPSGVGLEGIYDSAMSLTRTLVDMGISSAGVRQISAAFSSGDRTQIAITVTTINRICLVLGLIGTTAFFIAREAVSQAVFGNTSHANDIGLLSITLLIGAIAGRQAVLLTGTRRISDLAKMNIIGAIAGACISIPIVYFWGQRGVVAYLVVGFLATSLIGRHFASRVKIEPVNISTAQFVSEGGNLLKLGLVFLSTGLMPPAALFFIRTLIIRQEGLIGAGQFQAASALATVYVGFILQAMGTDFYPRLTAVSKDNQRCNQLVNEQAEISILLALPGVLATLTCAPWVIWLFYSSKFNVAAAILCWQITGMFLQVNSWPMGMIAVAKGRGAVMFWADLSSYSIYAALGWLGLKWFGLPGVGMAYVGLYIFHWCMTYIIARKLSGFRWSRTNTWLSLGGLASIAVALWARLSLPEPWPTIIGSIFTFVVTLYCLKTLVGLIEIEKRQKYLSKFGWAAPYLRKWIK